MVILLSGKIARKRLNGVRVNFLKFERTLARALLRNMGHPYFTLITVSFFFPFLRSFRKFMLTAGIEIIAALEI